VEQVVSETGCETGPRQESGSRSRHSLEVVACDTLKVDQRLSIGAPAALHAADAGVNGCDLPALSFLWAIKRPSDFAGRAADEFARTWVLPLRHSRDRTTQSGPLGAIQAVAIVTLAQRLAYSLVL
jgi:hypothetical protein